MKKTNQFKASFKLVKKRGLDISLLEDIVEKLRTDKPLEANHRNHELTGNFKGVWECHIQPDWLLLNLFGNFSFGTGYFEMRCSKSRYLCALELVDQFDNEVIELAFIILQRQ
ncbi:MAG: type II toxin-antitoxin system YafQ family toxin [Treponema sp.]